MLLVWSLYLDGEDEAGVEKYRHNHNHKQQAQFFISLAKGIDETLQTSEVSDHLEDSHDSHDPQQSDNLASLSNDLQVLQTKEDCGEEERRDSQEVDHIHFVTNKPSLPRADSKSRNMDIRQPTPLWSLLSAQST